VVSSADDKRIITKIDDLRIELIIKIFRNHLIHEEGKYIISSNMEIKQAKFSDY